VSRSRSRSARAIWAEELGVGFEAVLLVLLEVVIREFDRLKESGNQQTRAIGPR
jgi:hypothetical protein